MRNTQGTRKRPSSQKRTRSPFAINGRTRAGRRFKALFTDYMAQTGGKDEALCRQAAALVLQREMLDAAIVRGEPVNTLHLARLAGAINITLSKLRKLRPDPDAEQARSQREREDREALLA
jgi:hypothetical protein